MQICLALLSCICTHRTFIPNFYSSTYFQSLQCLSHLTLNVIYFRPPCLHVELTFYWKIFQNSATKFLHYFCLSVELSLCMRVSEMSDKSFRQDYKKLSSKLCYAPSGDKAYSSPVTVFKAKPTVRTSAF